MSATKTVPATNAVPAFDAPSETLASVRQHRLDVEAEADANVLLRLLEPFVVHNVMPHRVTSTALAGGLFVRLEFAADANLAERLAQRVAVMVPVRSAVRTDLCEALDQAA